MIGRRARADAGFLLAETLATFTLSAFVMLGLVSAATVLLRATDRSVAEVGAIDELGRTMAALARDISSAQRARWAGEEPQGFVFKGGPNSLFFAQEVPDSDGGRRRRVVSFREIVVGGGTALMRSEARLSSLARGFDDLSFGPQRSVPTGAVRLRFRYVADRGKDGRVPKPENGWVSGLTLPEAVIVEAVDADSKRLVASRNITIHANGDIGCAGTGETDTPGTAPPRKVSGSQPVTSTDIAAPGSVAPAALPPAQSGESDPDASFCGRADKVAAGPDAAPSDSTVPAPFDPTAGASPGKSVE